MKNLVTIILFSTTFATITYAASLTPESSKKITNACIASAKTNGTKIKNTSRVCECIGKKHLQSALNEPNKNEGEENLQWTLDFYETTDTKKLNLLIKKKPFLSDFDDQVVDECVSRNSNIK